MLPGSENAGSSRNPHDIPAVMYNALQDNYALPEEFFCCPLEAKHTTTLVGVSQVWIGYGYYRQRKTLGGTNYMPDAVAGPIRIDDNNSDRDLAGYDWTWTVWKSVPDWTAMHHCWAGRPESSKTLWGDGHVRQKAWAEVQHKYTSSRPSDIWW